LHGGEGLKDLSVFIKRLSCDFRPIFLGSVAGRSLRKTIGRAKIRFAGMSP
jgi:hypothetical protein